MSARFQGLSTFLVIILIYVSFVNLSYFAYVRETTQTRRWLQFNLVDSTVPPEEVHIVFSSSCSPPQEWQSQVLLWSLIHLAKQPGAITRIVSGCSEEQKRELLGSSSRLDARVRLHFTPAFPAAQRFYYFNKPLGIDHWLNHAEIPVQEEVVVILDPDMIVFDPIYNKSRVRYMKDGEILCTSGCVNRHFKRESQLAALRTFVQNLTDQVKPGFPLAQTYGLGSAWQQRMNLTELCGEGSNAAKITPVELRHKYSIGPPYLLANEDIRKLAPLWVKYMEPVYHATEKSDLLADMYAYNLAAIELGMPHIQLDHYMVSRRMTRGEAWPWVNKILETKLSDGQVGPKCSDPLLMNDLKAEPKRIPSLLHFAQRYTARDGNHTTWVFAKGFVPKNLLTCELPLLIEPPDTLIQRQTAREFKHNAWMLCTAIKYLNLATTAWKQDYCRGGSANLEKRIRLFEQLKKCPESMRNRLCWSHAKLL